MSMHKTPLLFFLLLIAAIDEIYGQKKMSVIESIDKRMTKINDTLYADQYETSNLDYNIFLNDIAKVDSTLYNKFSVDSTKWALWDERRDRQPNPPLTAVYHTHTGFENYPLVNISFENGMAYCSWLTIFYNNNKNRKFRKVEFVLPTEQEWVLAAQGGKGNIIFPWGHNSMRDIRKGSWQGSFLANFTRSRMVIVHDSLNKPAFKSFDMGEIESGLNDRAFYTAPVSSFFPNAIGLFNISGNVAEMTNQKGLTKGGSWHSYGGELTIQYKLYFYEPSPEVGFRVFMKIVEQ